MESVIHGSVRSEYGEREYEVVVRTNDAELVHGGVIRSDVRLDDFFGFFLQVVEGVGVEVVVSPACNDETDVRGGIFVEFITVLVFFEPADGVVVCRVVGECCLSATLVDVEASLFGTEVLGMRICEFVGAHEFFTDGDCLPYAV